MENKSISEVADSFGLTIETEQLADHDDAIRVYKGARQIFIGTEYAVREYLATYKEELPGPNKSVGRGLKE